MRVAIYVALVAALGLSTALGPVARRLAPRPGSILLAVGSLAAGLIWVGGLGLLSLATLGRITLVGELGHWSVTVVDAHDPVPVAAGLASLLILTVVTLALGVSSRRLIHGVVRLVRLHRSTAGLRCGDLAVIDTPAPEAMTLPGWRGSVVVTSGMLRVLEPAERRVLLAHERSHLHGRHWLFRLGTRLGAALLPTARPLVAHCDQALERWADEDAAAEVGDRRLTATAVARAALATTAHHRSVLAPAISDGSVADRVQALLAPPRRTQRSPALLPIGLAVVSLIAAARASQDLDRLFDAAKLVWRL